jgi:hypothetical protein
MSTVLPSLSACLPCCLPSFIRPVYFLSYRPVCLPFVIRLVSFCLTVLCVDLPSICHSSCLLSVLPSCLPVCACLSCCRLSVNRRCLLSVIVLPACLQPFLCHSSGLLSVLTSCLPVRLPVMLPCCLSVFLSTFCLPYCLPVHLPALLPAVCQSSFVYLLSPVLPACLSESHAPFPLSIVFMPWCLPSVSRPVYLLSTVLSAYLFAAMLPSVCQTSCILSVYHPAYLYVCLPFVSHMSGLIIVYRYLLFPTCQSAAARLSLSVLPPCPPCRCCHPSASRPVYLSVTVLLPSLPFCCT